MALGKCDLALHHPLELAPVGQPRQVIGARLARELTRAIDRDRDLVRDGRHEEKIGRAEHAVAHRAHRHHAHGPAFHPKLGAERIPFVARHAIDLGFRSTKRRGVCLDMRAGLTREAVDLVLLQPDGMRELERRALSQPHRPGAQSQRRERPGKPAEALARFKSMPESAESLRGQALALQRLGRHGEAGARPRASARPCPDDARIELLLVAEQSRAQEPQ